MRHLFDGAFILIMRSVQKQVVRLLFGFLFLGFSSMGLFAQSQLDRKIEITSLKNDTTIYLGDWVIEQSIQVFPADSLTWRFDKEQGLIQIRASSATRILIEYSTLPISLPKNISINKRLELITDTVEEQNLRGNIESRSSFDSELTQSGSLSRGIIVGSNQDFALESGLNFELSGQLTNDITLDAVLTDQSIPIQPDGTTQSIREFDKVLIRLQSQNTSLEMGDVDVSLQQSTFAKLNRRLQGASGSYNSEEGSISAAVSSIRGTFLTQQFMGEDGVQGPYRLRGKNGEEFIIVLAGTERVYLNGIQVQRGEESEYIIDYGLGEVTFTNNVFIKDETRIFVEYEYIDQDFNRTLVAAEAQDSFFDDRLKMGISVIRQMDGDELLSQQSLSEQDIRILEQAGDNLSRAVVSGVVSNPDDNEINVRYARIDTTVNGEVFSIFKNIPGSPFSNLVVRFSNVGIGNGSYERVGNTINGLLYNWVGPEMGSYEPFRQLPAPQKHQMLAVYGQFQLADNVLWSGEFSLSDFDKNRYSNLDNGDNSDIAILSDLSIRKQNIGFADLNLNYTRRQSGDNFQFFERTREVEFDRKWNLEILDISGETIDEFRTEFSFSENSNLTGEIGRLSINGFESIRQNTHLRVAETNAISIDYTQEFISSDNAIVNRSGSWFRQMGRVNSQISTTISPFLVFEHEDRSERNDRSELLSNSLKFYEIGPGIGFTNSKFDISAAYLIRQEEGVINGVFRKEATSREQRYEVGFISENGFRTENRIHFRNKDFSDIFESEGRTDQNGFQINSTSSLNRESISTRIIYRANTERQAIRQEAYIEVGPELGQYVWIDENENGIEEIDEFFPELSPNEGTYVLQFLPSDNLLPIINLNSRWSMDWKPFEKLKIGSRFNDWYKTIRLNSLIDLRENSTSQNESDIYLLKLNNFRSDSTTLQGSLRIEQSLQVEPHEKLSFRLSYNYSDNLNRRTTELQRKKSNQFYLDSNYQLNRIVRLRLSASGGNNQLSSDELVNRSYNIRYVSVNPGVSTQVNRSFQYGINVGYIYKEDQQIGFVNAKTIKLNTFTRAFLWQKIQASANVEIRDTKVSGRTNAFTNFELTEGTGSGTNIVWSLLANYRINNMVRMTLNYDGRTVFDRPDIHTVKLVVSAVF